MKASEKIKRFRRSFPGVLIGAVFCVLLILFAIYPHRPDSTFVWAVLFIVALPLVLFLEYMGEILFENKIMLRVNRLVRILLGVFVVLLLCAIIIFIWVLAKPYLGAWG